ncbi:MAG: GatB/YqeY domain-containing protein [Nitrospirota bacterium]
MSLLQKLDDDLKSSLKTSDRIRVSVIRMAKAALKNRQIAKGSALSDDEILSVLSSLAKQNRESIDQFLQGGRKDLAEKEQQELAIIQSYLPQQLSGEEIDRIIGEAIQESAAQGPQDIGKLMRLVMPRIKGAADGSIVNKRAREILETI